VLLVKSILLSIILLISFDVFAKSKREQLLDIVNEELQEITRLNKQTRSSRPTLLLRMAEVLLEKARIVKEGENEKFINLTSKQRSKLNRKKFFKESNKYFIQAQKTCFFILKRFPKFRNRGDVYYILAYNAKEFSDFDSAKKYFSLAVKSSSKKSYTRKKSLVALAEFYYNQQDYVKAIPMYEKALQSTKSRWYTKDLFNLSWCYFRVGKKQKAIKSMQKAYKLSGSKKYIDMRYAVERDLAYFYTAAGKVKAAIRFYKKIGGNIANNLVKVGRHLINQGKFTPAEAALVEAMKYKPSDRLRIDAYFSLLTLYDKYGKTGKHLSICKKLVKDFESKKLREDEVKDLQYHLKKYSAVLQKQVAGDTYKSVKKTRRAKANQSVAYFQLLAKVDPVKSHEHLYFAGETYFAIGSYGLALDKYAESREIALKRKNKKYHKLSVEGMLACFSHPKAIGRKRSNTYFPIVTDDFIKLNPKNKETDKLIQRLFSYYLEKKNILKAEAQLNRYVAFFPKKYKIQEAMLARVMDFYKAKKDKEGIKKWVKAINQGKIRVSKKYAARLKYLLLAMQFENVEKFNTKGEKKGALQGYVEIYKSAESTTDAKKNAAYNISVLFHELGNLDMMHGWLKRAVSMMNHREILKFSSSFLVMISDLNNQGRFKEAHHLYSSSFEKICKKKSKTKSILFQNAITIELIEPEIGLRTTEQLLKNFKDCRISSKVQKKLLGEIIDYLYERDTTKELELIYEKYRTKSSYLQMVARLASEIARIKERLGDSRTNEFYLAAKSYYKKIKKKGLKPDFRILSILSNHELNKIENRMRGFADFTFSFPRNKFANTMTNKFKEVAGFKKSLENLYEYGVGDTIVSGNKLLLGAYDQFIAKIKVFTPKGFSEANLKLFQKEMETVVKTLQGDKDKIVQSSVSLIQSQRVLSRSNADFLVNPELKDFIVTPRLDTVIMDRFGRQR
jgi:hypothetical protein